MSRFAEETGPLESRLAAGLAKIGLALKHAQWRSSSEKSLSPTQAQILVTLAGGPPGGSRVSDLASRLGLSPATVSESVATAESKGLVARRGHPHDGRVTLVALTEAGRGAAAQASGWTEFLSAALDVLDPEEQAALLRTVVKIIKRLQEEGRIPVARMCVSCTYFRPNAHPGEPLPHHCSFVDAAFGDDALRIDCGDFEAAPAEVTESRWAVFANRP